MTVYLVLGLVILGIAFGVFANSRWAGERGWVYNKHNPRSSGVGLQPGAFDEIYQPSVRHIIEEQASELIRADQDESGDGFLEQPHDP
ncbi:MAG: hypothetical protein QNJ77_07520 [Acidimicrobiia bacterium]|nr:hypothetical protein [Acidimicrobiia bacterium]